jgi:hypothetical protein
VSFSIEAFAEAERLFAVATVGNDRLGPTPMQFGTQLGAVVGFVAEQVFRGLHSADQSFSDRTVVCFASGQQNGEEAPFN